MIEYMYVMILCMYYIHILRLCTLYIFYKLLLSTYIGGDVVECKMDKQGHVDMMHCLQSLYTNHHIRSVLIEGGAYILQTCLELQLAQQVSFHYIYLLFIYLLYTVLFIIIFHF
jgi:hypothetical protein